MWRRGGEEEWWGRGRGGVGSKCVGCAYLDHACLPSKPQLQGEGLQWLSLRFPAVHCGSAPGGWTAPPVPARPR